MGAEGKEDHLRKKRSERLLAKRLESLGELTADDAKRLIQELHVYQIELEMQNEELRRAQEQLEESRNKYADLYDFAPVGYFTLDINGLILEVNLTGTTLLGVEKGYLFKQQLTRYIARENYEVFFSFRRQLLGTLNKQSCKLRMLRGDGTIFYAELEGQAVYDDKGNFSHFNIVALDITEHKKAEDEIYRRERELRLITDNIPVLISYVDSEQRYRFVNKGYEDWFGHTGEQLYGKHVKEVLGEPVYKMIHKYIEKALSGQRITYETEISLKDAGVRYISSTYIPDLGDYRNVKGFFAVDQDITDRKRAEEQINTALKEKETLLKEIHHRVKNNLQVVISLLNLQSRSIKDKEAREKFKESQNRIKSMSLIHEKLYQSEDLRGVNFKEYVGSLLNHLFRSYGAGSGIKLAMDIDDVLMKIDKAIPCGLIINELVSNSLKHAFPAGKKGEIRVALKPDKGGYIMTIGNNGVPLPDDVNFRDAKSLGLQLVCALVDQLKGTIELNRSKGTGFKIRFNQN